MSYVCKERLIETIRQQTCIELCPQKMACHDDLRGECLVNDVVEIVKGFEPDEVDEVRHGEWLEGRASTTDDPFFSCNLCWGMIAYKKTKYCPYCGARMDGE